MPSKGASILSVDNSYMEFYSFFDITEVLDFVIGWQISLLMSIVITYYTF